MADYLNQITGLIPQGLREKVLGSTRRELLTSVSDTLLVFGENLLHLESARSQNIETDAGSVTEAAVAKAAESLLVPSGSHSILLLLAPSDFLATQLNMPGLTGVNLRSAIVLQRESILPACDEELALAVANDNPTGDLVALWMYKARLNAFFDAFSNHGLTLAAIAPRALALGTGNESIGVLDDDGSQTTYMRCQNGVLEQWLQVKNNELNEPAFLEQWQNELAQFETQSMQNANSPASYSLDAPVSIDPSYAFFPAGSLAISKKAQKGRQLKMAAAVFAAVVLIASLPFLAQALELQMANARLESNRELSVDAREDQSIVVEFESRWGPINDFPEQEVGAAMFRLQEVLAGEQLSSLELSEGLIRIQGTSADPQAILQRLEQDPMFTEVVFSRATSNTRYYIDLRLATVNFEAYMVRYFPE